jgi:hypothetical protein
MTPLSKSINTEAATPLLRAYPKTVLNVIHAAAI